MLKILHARLQHYENQDLPDVQAGFRKGRETRDQIASICWIIGKAREFQKKIYLCFVGQAHWTSWLKDVDLWAKSRGRCLSSGKQWLWRMRGVAVILAPKDCSSLLNCFLAKMLLHTYTHTHTHTHTHIPHNQPTKPNNNNNKKTKPFREKDRLRIWVFCRVKALSKWWHTREGSQVG